MYAPSPGLGRKALPSLPSQTRRGTVSAPSSLHGVPSSEVVEAARRSSEMAPVGTLPSLLRRSPDLLSSPGPTRVIPPVPVSRLSPSSPTSAASPVRTTAAKFTPFLRDTVPLEDQAFFEELLRDAPEEAPGVYWVRGVSVATSASLFLVMRALDEARQDLEGSPDDAELLAHKERVTNTFLTLCEIDNDPLDRVTAVELAKLLSIKGVSTVFRAERSGTLASLMPPGSPQAAMASPDWGRNLLKSTVLPASPSLSDPFSSASPYLSGPVSSASPYLSGPVPRASPSLAAPIPSASRYSPAPVSLQPSAKPRNVVFMPLAEAVVVAPELAARGVTAEDLEPIIDQCRRLREDYLKDLNKWTLVVMVTLCIAWPTMKKHLQDRPDSDINGYLDAQVNPRLGAKKIRMQYDEGESGEPRLRIDLL